MINNVIKHDFLNLNKVVHGFFSSSGGFSKGPYKSLNCSFNNEDNKKNVFKNLEKIRNHLCLKQLIQIKQIHSNKVIHLKKSNFLKPVEADGMVTKMKNVGFVVARVYFPHCNLLYYFHRLRVLDNLLTIF